jgi:hypothetical protein
MIHCFFMRVTDSDMLPLKPALVYLTVQFQCSQHSNSFDLEFFIQLCQHLDS